MPPKLFLVDDDHIWAFVMEKTWGRLKAAGSFHHFENGQLAFDFINNHLDQPDLLPDIILLDLRMPVMDGWEFMQAFSCMNEALLRKTKIYIVTSSALEKDITRSNQFSQVADYIIKPVTQEDLLKLIYTSACVTAA